MPKKGYEYRRGRAKLPAMAFLGERDEAVAMYAAKAGRRRYGQCACGMTTPRLGEPCGLCSYRAAELQGEAP